MTAKIKKAIPSSKHYKHRPRGVSPRAFERVYWPYLPLVLFVTLLLGLSSSSGALQSAMRIPTGRVLDYATSMTAGGLLASTNSHRASNGRSNLSLNEKLSTAAQAKANDMATRNYWSHNTPEGNPPWVFVSAQGYAYQRLGENLAAGFDSEQSTVDGWVASPPHLENLVNPSYTDVGFGFANNADYTSAGGGPMTIVVAFYGQPVVTPIAQSQPSSKPPVAASPPKSTPAPAPAVPEPTTPSAEATSNNPPLSEAPSAESLTSEDKKSGITLSIRTSRAQLAFSKTPLSGLASGLALFAAILAIVLWISRHVLAIRRAWVFGEKFAIRHPLVDISLLVIAALAFLLSQTAGYIK